MDLVKIIVKRTLKKKDRLENLVINTRYPKLKRKALNDDEKAHAIAMQVRSVPENFEKNYLTKGYFAKVFDFVKEEIEKEIVYRTYAETYNNIYNKELARVKNNIADKKMSYKELKLEHRVKEVDTEIIDKKAVGFVEELKKIYVIKENVEANVTTDTFENILKRINSIKTKTTVVDDTTISQFTQEVHNAQEAKKSAEVFLEVKHTQLSDFSQEAKEKESIAVTAVYADINAKIDSFVDYVKSAYKIKEADVKADEKIQKFAERLKKACQAQEAESNMRERIEQFNGAFSGAYEIKEKVYSRMDAKLSGFIANYAKAQDRIQRIEEKTNRDIEEQKTEFGRIQKKAQDEQNQSYTSIVTSANTIIEDALVSETQAFAMALKKAHITKNNEDYVIDEKIANFVNKFKETYTTKEHKDVVADTKVARFVKDLQKKHKAEHFIPDAMQGESESLREDLKKIYKAEEVNNEVIDAQIAFFINEIDELLSLGYEYNSATIESKMIQFREGVKKECKTKENVNAVIKDESGHLLEELKKAYKAKDSDVIMDAKVEKFRKDFNRLFANYLPKIIAYTAFSIAPYRKDLARDVNYGYFIREVGINKTLVIEAINILENASHNKPNGPLKPMTSAALLAKEMKTAYNFQISRDLADYVASREAVHQCDLAYEASKAAIVNYEKDKEKALKNGIELKLPQDIKQDMTQVNHVKAELLKAEAVLNNEIRITDKIKQQIESTDALDVLMSRFRAIADNLKDDFKIAVFHGEKGMISNLKSNNNKVFSENYSERAVLENYMPLTIQEVIRKYPKEFEVLLDYQRKMERSKIMKQEAAEHNFRVRDKSEKIDVKDYKEYSDVRKYAVMMDFILADIEIKEKHIVANKLIADFDRKFIVENKKNIDNSKVEAVIGELKKTLKELNLKITNINKIEQKVKRVIYSQNTVEDSFAYLSVQVQNVLEKNRKLFKVKNQKNSKAMQESLMDEAVVKLQANLINADNNFMDKEVKRDMVLLTIHIKRFAELSKVANDLAILDDVYNYNRTKFKQKDGSRMFLNSANDNTRLQEELEHHRYNINGALAKYFNESPEKLKIFLKDFVDEIKRDIDSNPEFYKRDEKGNIIINKDGKPEIFVLHSTRNELLRAYAEPLLSHPVIADNLEFTKIVEELAKLESFNLLKPRQVVEGVHKIKDIEAIVSDRLVQVVVSGDLEQNLNSRENNLKNIFQERKRIKKASAKTNEEKKLKELNQLFTEDATNTHLAGVEADAYNYIKFELTRQKLLNFDKLNYGERLSALSSAKMRGDKYAAGFIDYSGYIHNFDSETMLEEEAKKALETVNSKLTKYEEKYRNANDIDKLNFTIFGLDAKDELMELTIKRRKKKYEELTQEESQSKIKKVQNIKYDVNNVAQLQELKEDIFWKLQSIAVDKNLASRIIYAKKLAKEAAEKANASNATQLDIDIARKANQKAKEVQESPVMRLFEIAASDGDSKIATNSAQVSSKQLARKSILSYLKNKPSNDPTTEEMVEYILDNTAVYAKTSMEYHQAIEEFISSKEIQECLQEGNLGLGKLLEENTKSKKPLSKVMGEFIRLTAPKDASEVVMAFEDDLGL